MLLRTENLSKRFGGEFLAIDRVSTQFDRGVLTSVIGPNGAGKTTFINLLSGSLRPDIGEIYFNGESIAHLATEKRVKKGICRSFQITNIFPELGVLQNIKIPLIYYHRRSLRIFSRLDEDEGITKESLEILKEIGLVDKRELKASFLSHGEQRQLEIGIALATHPQIVFLDEPTQGMNTVEKVNIMQNVVRFAKEGKSTFVIVEHDMDVVFSVSQRIIVLHAGRIIADGTPEQIRNDDLVRKVYLGQDLWTS
jgi:branched-chain amino acid transport system ATP-binding protein